jgi:DNA-binding NtrC family response regulator
LPHEWLARIIGHALGMSQLRRVESAAGTVSVQDGMVGECESMRQLFRAIRKIAASNAPVFISGESGTGKELTARALHERSARRKAPFVAINCGAIAHQLMQSELFGHERGAFTGAVQRKVGRVEAANGGTVFLDEIGDLPIAAQAGLLRFLQEGTIERLGGHESIPVDVRIISATHVDLDKAIEDGRFRADLFHRLCVLRVKQPALRERGRDITLLAHHVLHKFRADGSRRIRGFTPAAIHAMHTHRWPGNVRELINRVRRAIVLTECGSISEDDLGLEREERQRVTLEQARAVAERQAIETAIIRNGGRIGDVAAELGVSRSTLYRLMTVYGLHDSPFSRG